MNARQLSCDNLVRLACLLLVPWGLAGCRSSTVLPRSIKSPNGKLTLVASINQSKANPTKYLCVKFSILNAQGKVLHQEQTGASSTMRWSMKWQGNDAVVLDSADIGTYGWQQRPNGKWQQITPAGAT